MDPRPIQIMEFETSQDPTTPRRLKLHKDNLDGILRQAGERPVAIVSIVGPSRQGKSFFLGFMLRYLEALEKDESDWMDWDNKDKPLTGFKWRSGIDHETTGMLMWSKPFIVKANGSEVAVILMDTQGTYDQCTTIREMSAVVGLSLLCSSCLIFNFFNNLQEDVLNSLEAYIQYGLMALGNNDENAMDVDEKIRPFQKLFFLIRDWSMPREFPYGAKGGKSFLEKKLEVKEGQTPQVQKIRRTLKECFDELDCFLMPNPGEKEKLEGFTGCLSQLSTGFAKKLEELINDLLNPDELPIKSVFGNEIMATDIGSYFEQYLEVFNGDETPEPATLMEATCKIANQNLVNKCKRKYKDTMKKKQRGKKFLGDSVILKAHKNAMADALKDFKSSRKMGDPELIKSSEEDLIFVIKEEFDKIEDDNRRKRSKLVEEALQDSIKSYKEVMQDQFEDEDSFLEEKRLKSESKTAKQNSLEDFKEKLGDEEDEKELEKSETNLTTRLEEEESRILLENKNRLMNAEQKMALLVSTIEKNYHEEMLELLEENPLMSHEDLVELDKSTCRNALEKFKKVNKVDSKDFVNRYLKELQSSLAKSFEEIQKTHKLQIQDTESAAESLLNETIDEYRSKMQEELDGDDAPEIKHQQFVQKVEDCISNKNPYANARNSDLSETYLSKVKGKLDETFKSVQRELAQKKKDIEESYEKAVEKAVKYYEGEMKAFAEEGLPTTDDLNQNHELCLLDAIDIFDKEEKIDGHPTPQIFSELVQSKIKSKIEEIIERNTEKRSLILAETKNNLHESHTTYQTEMVKKLDLAGNEDQLKDFHEEALKNAIDNFKFKCQVQDESFIEPYLEQLKSEINDTFSDDIKDVFGLKVMKRGNATATALVDARKFYREEMEKHYKNAIFMKPKDLEDLHDKTSKLAIDKCKDKTPLSEIQVSDLKDALLKTYQEYKEKNDMNVPVDPAIGIDLGTTYSCVSVYLNGGVKVIPNAQGKPTTPSYVSYNDKGFAESVGEPAKSKAYENAENTIYDAKRIIGRKWDDEKLQNDMKYWAFTVIEEQQVPEVQINGKSYHPEQISAEVLKEMRVAAEKFLNCTVENAVITVPAYFTDGQRQATIDAGEIAGLKVLNILTEPVAAAISYKLQHKDDDSRYVLIFDLGGGTFDVAVLKMSKGKIETLAVEGDTHLGGEDFDQNIMKYCALEFKRVHGIDLMAGKDGSAMEQQEVRRRLKRLQLECERRKIDLASCRTVDICVDGIWNEEGVSTDLKVTLTQVKFENLNDHLFDKTIEIVEKCLLSAGVEKSKIEDIVLVGGSTRIPKVQELLTDYFEGKALNKTINPDEAVAHGAAVQAAIMNGQIAQQNIDFNKVVDVIPMSLGIEVYGGDFSVILPKSCKIPAKIKEQYRTAHNNQTSVQIMVYQGENPVAKNNSLLGEFILNGIPPADANREIIDVTMEINLQGILHITAVCTSTADTGSITVTEHKNRMGKEKIKRILAEAKPGAA